MLYNRTWFIDFCFYRLTLASILRIDCRGARGGQLGRLVKYCKWETRWLGKSTSSGGARCLCTLRHMDLMAQFIKWERVQSDSQGFWPEQFEVAIYWNGETYWSWEWEETRNSTLEMHIKLTHGSIKKKVRHMNLEFRKKVQALGMSWEMPAFREH